MLFLNELIDAILLENKGLIATYRLICTAFWNRKDVHLGTENKYGENWSTFEDGALKCSLWGR